MALARLRLPFLALAALSLLAAMWAGWVRLGWNWPVLQTGLPAAHGVLMVSGFLGTLVTLERAVALRQPWIYTGPLLTGVSGTLLIAGAPTFLCAWLIALGSLILVAALFSIVRQHPAAYTFVMAAGGLCWAIGNILWLSGWSIPRVVLWWAAFLVFTIAGERLELGRLLRLTPTQIAVFTASCMIAGAGVLVTIINLGLAMRLAGAGLIALALWLLRYDIARRTIRQRGLPRFVAACLLSGYGWLAVAGGIGLTQGAMSGGPIYDAFLHAIFVGFVISMIFGHAPIIFPAVLNLPIRYSPRQYIPLALLHGSLVVRVAGDLALISPLRLWGGVLNGIAILLFLFFTLLSLVQVPGR
jgi:hypothetical protein